MYEQAYIKERIDDHIKWYGAKAGQSDYNMAGKITINTHNFSTNA